MKDLEQIIPFLREFFNERGLPDVKIELTLSNVDVSIVNETHSDAAPVDTSGYMGQGILKTYQSDKGAINLFSKYF
jgi:hypothetical protein